ncbi:20086_t:CDS:2 [Gigaspora rosea]|nr:20086_t:CDS:2 [Gigaspora rosea]
MALGSQKQKWALCYTSCVFTAGMQTMQRVEGQNAIIKSTVNSHTSVLELFKKLDEQFSHAWIVDYLTPAALSIQRQEIAQAIWYVENTVDVPLIHLKELIPTNRYNDIIEIWELVRHRYNMSIIHQQHFTDGFQESSEAYINVVTYVEMPYKIANISYEHIHKSLNH